MGTSKPMLVTPSYEELRNKKHFWLQLTPHMAGMNETISCELDDDPVSNFLYYETNVTAIDSGQAFPYKNIRINISERTDLEVRSLTGKYPIGLIEFHEHGATFTLKCRNELVSRMVSTFSAVKNKEVEFLVTIPVLPTELPDLYPIINFQYRVRTFSLEENA
jgi:hypothetical protein